MGDEQEYSRDMSVTVWGERRYLLEQVVKETRGLSRVSW